MECEIEGKYKIVNTDCIPYMLETMEPESADCMICSVPFPSVYSYTNLESDIGNSEDLKSETKLHFLWWFRGLYRVMKPGRVAAIHCMQIPRLSRHNGMFDFRGFLIRLAKRTGFIYDNDWMIWKNAQSEAIRTHAHGLLFVTLERDRTKTRAAMGDYVIKIIKPGENKIPINSSEITREEWVDWASPCWHGVRQSYTLNAKAARSEKDSRHVCPMQLDTINRLIKLYSNPGELVFDPFSGIGSTAYECMRLGRRFIGTELKQEYYQNSIKNVDRAIRNAVDDNNTLPGFDMSDEETCIYYNEEDPIEEEVVS